MLREMEAVHCWGIWRGRITPTRAPKNNQVSVDGINVSMENYDYKSFILGMQCKYAFFKTIKQKRTIVYGLIANFALNRYGSGTYTYQKFSFENGNGTLSRRTNYFGIEITYSIFNKIKNEIQNP
jgi:hypothetical protein